MEAANQKDSGLGGVFGFAVTHTALRYILAQVKQVSVADLLCIIFLHHRLIIFYLFLSIALYQPLSLQPHRKARNAVSAGDGLLRFFVHRGGNQIQPCLDGGIVKSVMMGIFGKQTKISWKTFFFVAKVLTLHLLKRLSQYRHFTSTRWFFVINAQI